MPPQKLMRSFLTLWIVTGVVLLAGSAQTVSSGLSNSAHANPHLVLLGSVEALAAALFLVPRSMRLGAIALLITISAAFGVHTALHQFRGDLLLYAATVSFILVHGPLTSEQFRRAISSRA